MAKVSVILCTYNRDKYLRTTLEALALQSVQAHTYEVIIVNNRSTDTTENIALDFIQEHPQCSAKYFVEKQQGLSYARNRGISESSGDILTFIDDDSFVEPTYIQSVVSFFKTYQSAAAYGGKIIPQYETEEPIWMSKFLWPLVAALDMGSEVTTFKGSKFPIGANMGFRKVVFEKYGDFNTALGRKGKEGLEGGEEKDLFSRLKNNNETIYYTPEVSVRHVIPPKRLEMAYIKGLAVGVGTSEKKRVGKLGIGSKLQKIYSELVKIAGTVVLATYYSVTLQFAKAKMLLQFRGWVIKGYCQDLSE